MKKNINIYAWSAFLALIILTNIVYGQNITTDLKNSSVIIKGTSSVHDWEMTVETFKANAILAEKGEQQIILKNIGFSCQVEDIKSDKKIMDKKTYSALKSKTHPVISFQSPNDLKINGNQSTKMSGTLTVAGISKKVLLEFNSKYINNQLIIEGDVALQMSEFNISPPTALMGTLKTGDDIVVEYKIALTGLHDNEITDNTR